jgi:hypothetical protein
MRFTAPFGQYWRCMLSPQGKGGGEEGAVHPKAQSEQREL